MKLAAQADGRAALAPFVMLAFALHQLAQLARFLNGLVPMTSLIIARYESPCCDHCAWQEHAAIIDAVEAGDEAAALALMHEHLDRLEDKLNLE